MSRQNQGTKNPAVWAGLRWLLYVRHAVKPEKQELGIVLVGSVFPDRGDFFGSRFPSVHKESDRPFGVAWQADKVKVSVRLMASHAVLDPFPPSRFSDRLPSVLFQATTVGTNPRHVDDDPVIPCNPSRQGIEGNARPAALVHFMLALNQDRGDLTGPDVFDVDHAVLRF